MRPQILYPLFTELQYIKGIGPQLSKRFAKLCGTRIKDLVFLKPSSVIDRRNMPSINTAEDGAIATFEVEIEAHKLAPKRGLPSRVMCRNETGFLNLVFFNFKGDWIANALPIGEKKIISGRVEDFDGTKQIVHPDIIAKTEDKEKVLRLEPQYPLTQGVTQKKLLATLEQALVKLPDLKEWQVNAKISWKNALLKVHNPQQEEDIFAESEAIARLAYDELLAGQLAQGLVHGQVTKKSGVKLSNQSKLLEKLYNALPFKLTGGQEKALGEIFADFASGDRMFRLLQGDVGSGKTAVGLAAIMPIVESSRQAVFMMPTTLLANQQKSWIENITKDFGIKVELLTGNEKGKKREEILQRLANGEIDILVGTHALFQDWVKFKNLGLIIIDEQHRFGVLQRLKLSQKNEQAHILLMTATPIPRTLTIAFFGEMDISRITEKPAERLPIETLVMPNRANDILPGIKRAVKNGEKIYWICPLVEESEKLDLMAATERFEKFKKLFGDKVGLIHGRMKEAEKQGVLQKFIDGEHQILVSTTVIEVGIDVRDATIMFIEHAERFGLSQLHQLRGRVGRGDKKSTCILLYSGKLGATSEARLKVMKKHNDGFVIAEEDLKIRGSGEILGTRQSGFPELKFAQMPMQENLLFKARDEAKQILKTDPKLESERGKNLRILLSLFEYDETIEYISAG